ncbi:flagellar hook-length control protein FliK [Thiomicrorhabdus sp. ZW0627]|uniref:flagellar hook-length control protein FliK n=1 Tax=Thiomicrorhabdus sp. ZW0627 TaxID=3039774 RepID=UPI002436E12C|nr:flagellar hook-length control protein FliK [Thiomicrorhabdus sp. ZW0627]MDG6773317.1 flagellar hook-length control protein FliK [Thiomicrorhabdus sp. ZW0627]
MVNISQLNTGGLHLKQTQALANLNLKIGQSLTITVKQLNGDQAQLQIGKQTIIAENKLTSLTTGQLQVQVKQTQPTIILTIPKPNAAQQQNTQAALQQTTLQNGYKQFIGNQLPITQVLQNLATIPSLPQNIQTAIAQILEQLIRPSQTFDDKELKRQITNSGVFLENKLLNQANKESLSSDAKARLLKLQQQALNELAKHPNSKPLQQLTQLLTQALNKLTVQQLQLFENPLLLNIDLPIANQNQIENFRLAIHKRKQNEQASWEILLNMDIPQGELIAKLNLNEGQENLNCFLWCETPELEELVQQSLPQLQEQLQQLGLNVPAIQVVKSKPQQSSLSTQVALIDVHV